MPLIAFSQADLGAKKVGQTLSEVQWFYQSTPVSSTITELTI